MPEINSLKDIKKIIKKYENKLKEQYKVQKVFVFGSYARGEQTNDSDIDLLVELAEPIGMFKFVELQYTLEEILGKKIDLGTPNSLKPYIKNEILSEAVAI